MYENDLPIKITVGEEINESNDRKIEYLQENCRIKGIKIHYNNYHHLYKLDDGFKSGKGNSLTLLDKRPCDENGVDNTIPLDGIKLVELVETDSGYVEFTICDLEIEDFHTYLFDDFERVFDVICKIGNSHPFQVYKTID